MPLTEIEKTEMQQMIADGIASAMKSVQESSAPTTPETAPSPEVSAQVMLDQMKELIEGMNTKGQVDVSNRLFSAEMNKRLQTTPELKAYLEGTDDFGAVRLDALNSISDYDKRVEALDRIASKVSSAVVEGTIPPTPEVVAQQSAKETETDALYKKVETDLRDPNANATASFIEALGSELGSP